MPRSSAQRLRLSEIRDIALAQLFLPSPMFDAARYEAELEQIAADAKILQWPEYLEASILLVLAVGKRPRRAQKALYRLSKTRAAAHEMKVYDRFVSLIKEIGQRGHSLEGVYFPQTFQSQDHEEIWSDVRSVIEQVGTVIGPVFLNSGTLLGVVRDKGLIAHDDDIDLAVLLQADDQQSAALAWRETLDRLAQAGLLAPSQGPNPCAVKLQSGGIYNIDLFPAWIGAEHLHVYPHTCGDLTAEALLPLADCPVTGLPIPARPEAILAVNYGEGWREPDPWFSFPWNRANRRFQAFVDAVRMQKADGSAA